MNNKEKLIIKRRDEKKKNTVGMESSWKFKVFCLNKTKQALTWRNTSMRGKHNVCVQTGDGN